MVEFAFACAVFAGLLDVGANIASTKSEGMTKKSWGALSIGLVLMTFAFLAEAARGIDLAIAYAILGATGIFGTAISGRILFGHRLRAVGWLGLVLVFAAVLVLRH